MQLSDYAGKKITLTRNLETANNHGHLAEEIEGLVQVVAPDGSALVIRPKGSTMNTMIEAHEIEPDSIQVHIDKPRELKARRHTGTCLGNVRQHLLDRHTLMLTIVNTMTDDEAVIFHNRLDHRQLGHFHEANSDD